MVSMKDIARKLNLSRCTVSNVLNHTHYANAYRPETVARVKEAAREMGYISNHVAKSLKTGMTGSIALVVPDIANTFFINIIKEVERLANATDYSLIICVAEEDMEKENRALRMLQSRMVDGVLISPTSYTNSLCDSYSFKIMCFDRTVQSKKYPSIMINDEKAAYDLTKQLFARGSQKLLFLAGSKTNYTVECRLRGINRAYKNAGLPLSSFKSIYGIFDDVTAQAKIDRLLKNASFDFDGVLLSTNYFIFGVLKAFEKHSFSPKAIGGFENVPGLDLVNPSIIYVEHNEAEIARKSFEGLLDLLQNREVSDKVIDTCIRENH